MMESIFDVCVGILLEAAELTRMTYKTVNVWIFCILWPLFTLALLIQARIQRGEIKRLRELLKGTGLTDGARKNSYRVSA
ncbi:MAG: hypothetical protein Q8Q08_05530 [Candidatus Omnitrophota bacterium]|nr:hypothetical protein [Candidatus Omnitrophota bacterium]MDZ4242509.1 hypothetical protein [Candidatus Omnitrophota bacterium]